MTDIEKVFYTFEHIGSDYDNDLSSVECFDIRTNTWCMLPPLAYRRESVSLVATGGRLFAIGGACRNKVLPL